MHPKTKKQILLDMTLIEGHMNVIVDTDEGIIKDVRVQGIDSRYFEKFCEGMAIDDLPKITPRICGLCSASHHVASAMAVDHVYGVEIPPRAKLIRRAINYGIILNNHVIHLIMMGFPDLLLKGKNRSMLKLMTVDKELVQEGMKLVKLGHEAVRVFGGRDIHPVRAMGGGVAKPPTETELKLFKEMLEKHEEVMKKFVKMALDKLASVEDLIKSYPNGNKYFGAVVQGNKSDYYEGKLKIVDQKGNVVKEVDPIDYQKALKEYTFDWTYIKPVTVVDEEYPEGAIRVGPISRINIIDSFGTPWADELLENFRQKFGRYAWDPLLYHEARVIESVHMFEMLKELIEMPEMWEGEYLIDTNGMKNERGVGLTEAPRGILIHDVTATEKDGEVVVKKFNIITPTAVNAAAIENDLKKFLLGKNLKDVEQDLYRMVSSVVRSYDPCMACATHSVSKGPSMVIRIREKGKEVRVIKG
ncbi:hypothetical protein IPA_03495 [Ignicoccus pacificus DSM 13166]|uniref:Ni/Fe hydrogenase subunit alpha n=1 Tax=Ignicoccus pacificus DSM 13166 TaxID=940294 RepID=A0A977PK07_9CREN|nr:hypothetical protein IPA_03495 [Ignicoccus pacificus DSM 13166]